MELRPEARLVAFAREHHGLYRSADALELGLSPYQIAARVRRGLADRVGKGVYRVAGAPESREQLVLAAVWRTHGVASHRCAAWFHGILDRGPPRPEVTVGARDAHELDGVIVHRSLDLGRSRVIRFDGIPVTSVARTLVDLGQVVGERQLESALHRAMHRGLLRLEDLVEEYRCLSRPGRHGAGPIGRLLRELDPGMAPAESELELQIVRVLRRASLPEPVRQFEVEVDCERFRLDLAYPDRMLFLEGDGFGVHGLRPAFENDRRRQNLLVLAGWRPLRFTWRQVRSTPWTVTEQVAGALGLRGS